MLLGMHPTTPYPAAGWPGETKGQQCSFPLTFGIHFCQGKSCRTSCKSPIAPANSLALSSYRKWMINGHLLIVSNRIFAVWKCLKQMMKLLYYEYVISVHSFVPSHMLDPGPRIPLPCFHPHCYRSFSSHEYFFFYNNFLSQVSLSLPLRYYVLHCNAFLMPLHTCLRVCVLH